MVRGLVATMLKIGRGKMTMTTFKQVIEAKDCTKTTFAAPSYGLFLMRVNYKGKQFEC
jgi:tRNA pseudouridine38-40 synthase